MHPKEEYRSTRQGVSGRWSTPRWNSHLYPLKKSLGRLHILSGHFVGSLLIIELRSFGRSARSVFIIMNELPRLHNDWWHESGLQRSSKMKSLLWMTLRVMVTICGPSGYLSRSSSQRNVAHWEETLIPWAGFKCETPAFRQGQKVRPLRKQPTKVLERSGGRRKEKQI